MRKADKEVLKARLEAMYREWAAFGPEDSGRKQEKLNDIFLAIYDLFPGHEDMINTLFMTDWANYDPALGTLYSFFKFRIDRRSKGAYQKERKREERLARDTSDGGDGQDTSILDSLPAGPGSDPEDLLRLDATACELIAAVLELPQRLQGRANNAARHNYFRMFFTDNIAAYLHDSPELEVIQRRERDLFAALKVEFLDHFMARHCRSVEAVHLSPLKPYGELVAGKDMKETRLPLPGDVYISYLDRIEHLRVGPSAVSQQKQFYLQFVESVLYK